jgi:hypothetical protein
LQHSSNQYLAYQTGREILWIIHKILWGVGGRGGIGSKEQRMKSYFDLPAGFCLDAKSQ